MSRPAGTPTLAPDRCDRGSLGRRRFVARRRARRGERRLGDHDRDRRGAAADRRRAVDSARTRIGVDVIAACWRSIGSLALAAVPRGRGDRADAVRPGRRWRPTPTGGLIASCRGCSLVRRDRPIATTTALWSTSRSTTCASGDRLFVKSGEVVPVDGVLETDAVLDESALTGESRPVERPHGDLIRSGAVNAGAAFDLHATATAADSTYAGIVRLVREAERGEGAVRPARGPVRPDLRAGHPAARGSRVGGERRRDPGALRPRRSHAVPAAARRADRDRGGDLAVGEARDHREGWRRPRDPRPGHDPDVRQDGDPDVRDPGGRRRRELRADRRPTNSCVWRRPSTRFPRTCLRARSSVPPANAIWSWRSPRTSVRSTAPGSQARSKGGRWRSGRRRSSHRGRPSGDARERSVAARSWRVRRACSSSSTGRSRGHW